MARRRKLEAEISSGELFPGKGGAVPEAKVPPPKIAPLKPTKAYDTYWRLGAARQGIFFRRLEGCPPPWGDDPGLPANKSPNAYRAPDRAGRALTAELLCRTLPS